MRWGGQKPSHIVDQHKLQSEVVSTRVRQQLVTLKTWTLTLELFLKFMKNGDGKVKLVLIISSNGGPEENPRYRKKRDVIIHVVSILHPSQKPQNIDVRPITYELCNQANCDPRGLSQDELPIFCVQTTTVWSG
ncbi:hypothetical protein EVAR_14103_1 [Eumeta japonica]|uniref:Uncharacterized protein n=1 Tax=Eumeta variegata TaxID=151549 RepID=A0A4C1UPL0_EUMVA|nr:hypothetical protein EVAR_14103_1 [Eumeta japonica]